MQENSRIRSNSGFSRPINQPDVSRRKNDNARGCWKQHTGHQITSMNSRLTSARAAQPNQKNNALSYGDVIDQFCRAMGEQDIHISPADIVADGKLHRVRAEGDKDKTVWFVLHADDRPAGMFGCHRRYGYDTKFSWKADIKRAPMTAAEKRAYCERMECLEAERAAQVAADRAAAAERAKRLWDAAQECTEHPYLERKGVRSYGLRVGRWEVIDQDTGEARTVTNQALLIQIRDLQKKLHSLQAIVPEKREGFPDKWYLQDGAKEGHFSTTPKPMPTQRRASLPSRRSRARREWTIVTPKMTRRLGRILSRTTSISGCWVSTRTRTSFSGRASETKYCLSVRAGSARMLCCPSPR